MAKKGFWIGTTGPFYYDDATDVTDRIGLLPAGTKYASIVAEGLIKQLTAPSSNEDVVRYEDISELLDGTLDNNRLVDTDGSGKLDSVSNLTDYIDGTANEITVTDDGDGTVTLEGAGSDTDFTVVTAIQAGGAGGVGFQYKTRDLTLNGGIILTVGAESGWNDV